MTHPLNNDAMTLKSEISACRICTDRFAATATRHAPKPVVWFDTRPRILIASQAPGIRVHAAQRPFWDRSGDRLREWLAIENDLFYDKTRIAILPMAFCFPGYDAAGTDLPPPPVCARTWREPVMAQFSDVPLTLLIGGYAQRWHLGTKTNVTDTVRNWRDHAPRVFPLPHPSWRNTAWLKKNPWFAAELLPVLRATVKKALQ